MRLISWNIRAGGGRRVEDIADQLERWQPAVVALSEFRATPPSQNLAQALARFGLRYQLTTADEKSRAKNAVLLASSYELQQIRLPNEPEEPKRWLLARIKTGQPYTVGVMHVPNRVTGRKFLYHDAVLSVVKSWALGPGLLVGDTNTGLPGIDEETAVFNSKEKSWIESLEAAGWRDVFRYLKGDERVYTWYSPNGKNGFRLDQAFLNPALLARAVDMRYKWGQPLRGASRRDALSDHAAIILDLDENQR